MPDQSLIAALRAEIRALVREELAAARAELEPKVDYSSETLPPDCRSRRVFATRCRSIPGARRSGRGWTCPRAAWEADAERRHLARRRRPTTNVTPIRSPLGELARAIVDGAARPTKDTPCG